MLDIVDSRYDDPSYDPKPAPPVVAEPVVPASNMEAVNAAASAPVRGAPVVDPLALNAAERGPVSQAGVEQAAAAGVLPPQTAAAPLAAAPMAPAAAPLAQPGPAIAQQNEVTTQIAPKLSQDRKDATALAFEKQQQAIDSAARTEANKEEAAAAVKEYRQNELAKQRIRDQSEADQIKLDTDKAQNDWLKAQDDWKKASETKPPQETLGERIVNAIAIGIGAYASTMSGGPNQALQIVNNAREQRIRQWEREVEGAKGRAEMKGNLVAFYRNKGMDQRSAANAARLSLIDATDQQLDMVTSGYKSPEIRARAEAAKAANQIEREKYQNQNYLDEQNKQVRRTLTSPVTPNAEAQKDQTARTVRISSIGPDGQEVTREMLAPTPKDAETVKEAQDASSKMKANLDAIEDLVKNRWQSLPLSTARKELQASVNELTLNKATLNKLGALSMSDRDLASPLGDPSSITQSDAQTLRLINAERKRIADMMSTTYKNRGLLK